MPSWNWNEPKDAVSCVKGGIHHPGTFEGKDLMKRYVKFTACRKCKHVLTIIK